MREHPNLTSESNSEKSVRVLLVEDSAVLGEILSKALSELP
jgi:hypothetical protein